MTCQDDCGIRTGPDPFFYLPNGKEEKAVWLCETIRQLAYIRENSKGLFPFFLYTCTVSPRLKVTRVNDCSIRVSQPNVTKTFAKKLGTILAPAPPPMVLVTTVVLGTSNFVASWRYSGTNLCKLWDKDFWLL